MSVLALRLASDAYLKIERAKKHVTDLNTQTGDFFATGGLKFVVKTEPEARRRSISLKGDTTRLRELALIIGDAVHNLRARLNIP